MEPKVIKRYETVKCIRGVAYRYENLVIPEGRRTSCCLDRLEELRQETGRK